MLKVGDKVYIYNAECNVVEEHLIITVDAKTDSYIVRNIETEETYEIYGKEEGSDWSISKEIAIKQGIKFLESLMDDLKLELGGDKC